MTEIFLVKNMEGEVALGKLHYGAFIPLLTFSSIQELRKFAMGVLGFCEYVTPEVPESFIRAFEEG